MVAAAWRRVRPRLQGEGWGGAVVVVAAAADGRGEGQVLRGVCVQGRGVEQLRGTSELARTGLSGSSGTTIPG